MQEYGSIEKLAEKRASRLFQYVMSGARILKDMQAHQSKYSIDAIILEHEKLHSYIENIPQEIKKVLDKGSREIIDNIEKGTRKALAFFEKKKDSPSLTESIMNNFSSFFQSGNGYESISNKNENGLTDYGTFDLKK